LLYSYRHEIPLPAKSGTHQESTSTAAKFVTLPIAKRLTERKRFPTFFGKEKEINNAGKDLKDLAASAGPVAGH
jgi:hypothetical protein